MSHLVVIQTEIRDPVALASACRRLGLEQPVQGEADIFVEKASGWIVRLPGWTYPVVIDCEARKISYDTYNGTWGEQSHLDRLFQGYAVEKAKLEARRAGHSVTEMNLPDGSIKLTIQIGGAAQ
jgi:hypothetical protein